MTEEDIQVVPRDYIEVESAFNKNNLAIWAITYTKKGKVKKVVEYLEVKTGEIIPSTKSGIKVVKPDAMLERFKRLDELKDSVREFAIFLLTFRNRACGFMVPVDMIVNWYAKYSGKQPQHVRRLVQSLITGGILSNEYELESIFMINNPNRDWKDAKGDLCRAQVIFETKLIKLRNIKIETLCKDLLDETSIQENPFSM